MSASETIRDLLHCEPFVPFRIRLSSGDSYVVRNADLAVLMKTKVFVAAPNSDRQTLIPYLHIAAVETIRANGNGGGRRTAGPS